LGPEETDPFSLGDVGAARFGLLTDFLGVLEFFSEGPLLMLVFARVDRALVGMVDEY